MVVPKSTLPMAPRSRENRGGVHWLFVNRPGRNRNMARLKMQVMDEKGLGRMKDRVERMLEE